MQEKNDALTLELEEMKKKFKKFYEDVVADPEDVAAEMGDLHIS